VKRDTRSAYRARAAATERSVDAALADVRAAKAAEQAAVYAKRTAPVPFTPDELNAARAIRTSVGWHRVVKVNAKSVTVATGYSWNDRYTLDKILEVRA
jgi:hypothetical protein